MYFPCTSITIIPLILTTLLLLTAPNSATAAPLQFCKGDVALNLDFCLAISTYSNTSTSAVDLYIAITTSHLNASPLGWIALGLGPSMAGALMFIVFGDPSNEATALIRTAPGHKQPVPVPSISPKGHVLPEIRVVKSAFEALENSSSIKGPGAKILTAEIVCHNCSAWSGTTIDCDSEAQPWIWAANPAQGLRGDRGDAVRLAMHDLRSGYGTFWADLRSSFEGEARPSFPSISHSYTVPVGVTEVPPSERLHGGDGNPGSGSGWLRNWLWHLHGLLLATAFFVLYPAGAYCMHIGGSRAFKLHWATQASASVVVAAGVLIGVVQSRRIGFVHQFLGLSVAVALAVQALLGWRAHVGFVRTMRKSWFGGVHLWVGMGVVWIGSWNVVLGLVWRGYGGWTIFAAGIAVVGEVFGVAGVFYYGSFGWGNPGERVDGEEYAMLSGEGREDGELDEAFNIGEEEEDGK
jgi:Cytochrome domain of cellobiose dehydrogenase